MSAWCTEEENVKKCRQALFRLPGYKAIIALMNQNTPKLLRYLFPRFQDFVFISVLLLGVLLGPRFLGDGDPGRHIVIGQIILKEHYIPQTDIFSHTKAGLPLTTTEWLSEVLYAAANLAMGLNGVVLLAILVIALTCMLVFRETARRSRSYLAAFILVFWMVAATLFHWLARPHLFSWLMTVIWAVAAERLARGERVPLWLFPLSMLVWVNLHGGFIIGFLILVAYLIGWVLDRYLNEEDPSSWDVFKRLLQAGLFSLLVTVLNPSGLKLWDNVVGHVGDAGLTFLQIDWRSPDFHMPNTWPFLLLVALTIFAFAANKKKLAGGQALLCGGVMGVSRTLLSPNWSINPLVTPNTLPYLPTSSPTIYTFGSLSISSRRASLIAVAKFMVGMKSLPSLNVSSRLFSVFRLRMYASWYAF